MIHRRHKEEGCVLTRTWQVTVGLAAALLALFLVAKLRYAGKPTLKLPAENCNADLWKHVYEPERLHVIETCTAVEGRGVSVRRASDGDLHTGLDPEHKSVLNLTNVIHANGHLVVEVICDHAPAEQPALIGCAGLTPPVDVPKAGDRVRVTGAYVTDSENGWNEVHPVTRIEILH